MKRIIFVLCLLALVAPAFANGIVDKTTVSITGGMAALGVGTNSYGGGIGGLGIEFPINNSSEFGLSSSYVSYSIGNQTQSNLMITGTYKFEL